MIAGVVASQALNGSGGGGTTPAALDPSRTSSRLTLSNSNRTATTATSDHGISMADTAFASGKYYWEIATTAIGASSRVGMCPENISDLNTFLSNVGTYVSLSSTGSAQVAGATTVSAPGIGFANGDTMMFAYDAATKKLWMGKNGTWSAGGDPAAGTGHNFLITATADWRPAFSIAGNGNNVTVRFAAADWAQAAPSGFGQLDS